MHNPTKPQHPAGPQHPTGPVHSLETPPHHTRPVTGPVHTPHGGTVHQPGTMVPLHQQ